MYSRNERRMEIRAFLFQRANINTYDFVIYCSASATQISLLFSSFNEQIAKI